MSDHSKFLAEQDRGDEGHRIMSSDIPDLHDVLAENEQARFDAYVDAMSDAYDDGDEE